MSTRQPCSENTPFEPESMFECEVELFALDKIFDSGQVFRWQELPSEQGVFSVIAPVGGHLAMFSQMGDMLRVEHDGPDDGYWKRYLSLDRDYGHIVDDLHSMNIPKLDSALEIAEGIRIVNQPFFETLVTFTCSQNNNIPKIRNCIFKLCGEEPLSAFPSPEGIVAKLSVDTCSLGYRKEYIEGLCQDYIGGEFDGIETLSPLAGPSDVPGVTIGQVDDMLRSHTGIGPKVAACIELFSLGFDDAVPKDVWIKRAESDGMTWHPQLGGIQQQFVFFAERRLAARNRAR